MAWIAVDLDDTLVTPGFPDPNLVEVGQEPPPVQDQVVPGAPEAVAQMVRDGHRVTVITSRFAPMPLPLRQQKKAEIEQMLQDLGFPPVEVWAGFNHPKADIFISRKAVTYDDDWGLVLAQLGIMLEEAGVPSNHNPQGVVQ